jgi:hypothetical protein
MPGKRSNTDSLTLPPLEEEAVKTKRQKTTKPVSKKAIHEPTDEFQQVTKSDFVNRYRVEGARDVYYQPNVSPLAH